MNKNWLDSKFTECKDDIFKDSKLTLSTTEGYSSIKPGVIHEIHDDNAIDFKDIIDLSSDMKNFNQDNYNGYMMLPLPFFCSIRYGYEFSIQKSKNWKYRHYKKFMKKMER